MNILGVRDCTLILYRGGESPGTPQYICNGLGDQYYTSTNPIKTFLWGDEMFLPILKLV